MKILTKKSPLKLVGFQIEKYNFSVTKDDKNIDFIDLFERHSVGLDFDIFENDTNHFIMLLQCEIKCFEALNIGYDISLEASGMFSLDEKSIKKSELANYKGISSLNIMIGNLRGYLRTMTSYAYYGEYILTSIDIGDLLNNKRIQTISQ